MKNGVFFLLLVVFFSPNFNQLYGPPEDTILNYNFN